MNKLYIKKNKYGIYYYKDSEMTIRHREDGPACERSNGDKSWYQNGKLHRLDGPAIEFVDGDKEWWQNDELHRLNGPALECDGDKLWYQNGKLHRLDGPAVENADGSKEYWYQDEEFSSIKTNEQWKKHLKWMKFQ